MREFKFRLFDKKYNTFEYNTSPDCFISTEGKVYEKQETSYAGQRFDEYYESNDNYSISQYTGLKDHKGNDIYEGDIVKGKNRMHENWTLIQKVHFLNGCFMFGNWNAHEYFNKHTEIEVVGNIHNNPDILENS